MRECDTENYNENESIEGTTEEKIAWFTSICRQLDDVRELKAQYAREDAMSEHVCSWRKVPVWTRTNTVNPNITPAERFAPALTVEESEALYITLENGRRYSARTLGSKWGVTTTEARRRCYWLRKGQYVKYIGSDDTFVAVGPNERKAWRDSLRLGKRPAF